MSGPKRTHLATIRGEKKESIKFQNQSGRVYPVSVRCQRLENASKRHTLEALPRAIDLGRTRSGKDSPRYTQGVGPHVAPKMKTWRTANVMTTPPAALLRDVNAEIGVPGAARQKWPTSATCKGAF